MLNDLSVADTIKGFDDLDSTSLAQELPPVEIRSDFSIKDVRVGIPEEFACSDIDQEILQCWNETSDILAKSGATVSAVSSLAYGFLG